jgi:hypothetical protein
MTYMPGRNARIGFVILVATAMTARICGDAVAMVQKGPLQARSSTSESHVQVVTQEPAWLEPMRYYGGPKSPMWRQVR